ncbi:MAG TPA: hypothetical protein P5191_02235 [Ruminococcus sp.]|nr:hypothetical protein [Ruminococcus sp.]
MSGKILPAEAAALSHPSGILELFSSGVVIMLLIMIVGTLLCIGIAAFAVRWQEKKLREEKEEEDDREE